jgi:hypothetical protein
MRPALPLRLENLPVTPWLACLIVSLAVAGCRTQASVVTMQQPDTRMAAIARLAIITPQTADGRWRPVAARLETMAHEVLAARPDIQRVERTDLGRVIDEQVFQLSGRVGDETAQPVGTLTGADALLIFRCDGPSIHDLMLGRPEDMPPVVITAKIVETKTGSVLWHEGVTVPVEISRPWWRRGLMLEPLGAGILRTAVETALVQLRSDLEAAFQTAGTAKTR